MLISKFVKFVEWPNRGFLYEINVDICILGNDDIYKTLKLISNMDKSIKPFKIKNTKEIDYCEVIFIGQSIMNSQRTNFNNIKKLPILTISDYENFINEGGVIEFISIGNKISFKINKDAANNTGLQISSKLLNLSKKQNGL